ncbi:MAG TPA: adenylate/guanylate cyclase domain-containing protein [Gaiellaceae bacterium]|nr:adenylate/guanylate cyclase domain-containing protein [Gaiellaceae bacterium]
MSVSTEPETRYATRGDAHIAYQVVGDAPLDLVIVSTWFSHLEAQWEFPAFAQYLRRLASFTRLITFDKYGIGLSDPIPSRNLPPLEDWVDDVRAVMDAAGSEAAVILGANEGSMMATLFAATHPERTTALVLENATARMAWAPDYPIGVPREFQDRLAALVEESWGRGDMMAAVNPSLAGDPVAAEAWGRFLRLSASPATAAAVIRVLFELDVRDILPTIGVPTLVVNRKDNPVITPEQGRYVAERIPGAKFVAVPGADYGLAVGDPDAIVDEVEEFLTGAKTAGDADRVLATVLFTDIVGSTARLSELGDRQWREVLASHDALARRQVERYGGRLVDTTGDGLLATFDGPLRGIKCAIALRDAVRRIGLTIRAGVHTGEIERRGDDVAGLAVHIAARVQALAHPDEVLVSRTVKDLVTGAGLRFADRGSHELKGVPEPWELYGVEA